MDWKVAKPIFLQNKSKEMNIQALFRSQLILSQPDPDAVLLVSAAALYKLRINGKFVAYGPARAAHGYSAVDSLPVGRHLASGVNVLELEVAGYHCPTYYTLCQPSFLIAEVLSSTGKVLAATGQDFEGFLLRQRRQKTMRYSFQRAFTEVWNYNDTALPWPIEVLPTRLQYLPRLAPLPEYDILSPVLYRLGVFAPYEPEKLRRPSFITKAGISVPGFAEEELDTKPYYTWQQSKITWQTAVSLPVRLSKGQCLLVDMGCNQTGFICFASQVETQTHIMICFDEKLTDGIIEPRNVNMVNLVDYTLPAGNWEQETFEVYGLRYACIFVVEGSLELQSICVREYAYSASLIHPVTLPDPALENIHAAAIRSFRQNVVDVYMDCPTRERAGWLCDSYYTAQAEFALTGDNPVERAFMDHYRRYTPQWGIPKGMLPMCYPADHPNGNYIPQWAMWYILELEGFLRRSPDVDPADYRALCYDLLAYFTAYENEDGLLEKLPKWNFVEWSKANDWVQDVNYPTNMLYSRICGIIGKLYNDPLLTVKSHDLQETVCRKSFNGTWFVDHAVRNEQGVLENAADISEVCQYYAIRFLGLNRADPRYASLMDAVVTKFTADRDPKVDGIFIEPANALMGIYLRMEILFSWGCKDLLQTEIKAYFGHMAELTGTLWEHKTNAASMNHGFASFAGVILRMLETDQPLI